MYARLHVIGGHYWKRVDLWNARRDDPDGYDEAMSRILDAGRPAHFQPKPEQTKSPQPT